jgi:hypothetical protein
MIAQPTNKNFPVGTMVIGNRFNFKHQPSKTPITEKVFEEYALVQNNLPTSKRTNKESYKKEYSPSITNTFNRNVEYNPPETNIDLVIDSPD